MSEYSTIMLQLRELYIDSDQDFYINDLLDIFNSIEEYGDIINAFDSLAHKQRRVGNFNEAQFLSEIADRLNFYYGEFEVLLTDSGADQLAQMIFEDNRDNQYNF